MSMQSVYTFEAKQAVVQAAMAGCVGSRLVRYETAELLLESSEWTAWTDLPIRLYWDNSSVVSISWSKFDDLWIAVGQGLPFSIEGSTIRWVENALPEINLALGQRLGSVSLGRDEMTIADRSIPIWTRLLLELESGWLEVFNALDENGYEFHKTQPSGECRRCV